jgi:hypothetical protein
MTRKILFAFGLTVCAAWANAQSNGNVGIGTTNPASKLTVNGNVSIGSGYIGTAAPVNGAIIQGNVGVGTSAPQAKLQVGGNMILGNASSYSGTNASVLVRDNTTGEVKTAVTSSGNNKPLNYVEYTVSNVNQDKITDFDTKIPVSDYVVNVIGFAFEKQIGGTSGTLLQSDNPSGSPYRSFNPVQVQAFPSNGTWHIRADYIDGTPVSISTSWVQEIPSGNTFLLYNKTPYNGNWTFRCMLYNNNFIQTLPDVNTNLAGSTTSAAAAPPAGL